MKKLVNLLALIALLVIPSCVEEVLEPSSAGLVKLTGILEADPGTRTYIDAPSGGIYYPYWSGDEVLAVYADYTGIPERFVLESGKDTHQATFAGALGGSSYIAFYPFEGNVGREGDVLHFNLPEEQEYAPKSFASGSFPMLAVSGSTTLQFKNLCSVLKLSLTGSTSVLSISFTANDPRTFVSGPARVRTDQNENPVLTMSDGGSPSVKLVCGGVKLSQSAPTSFMLVIPPGTYKGGFTLKIKTPEGTVTHSTDKDIVFQRSQLRSIPAFEVSGGDIDLEDLPENMICYVTASGDMVHHIFTEDTFGCKVLSHTYEGGLGTIVTDGIVKKIGTTAFDSTDITEIYLPSTVESIEYRAFYHSGLTSFKVPEKLKSVGSIAFGRCGSLAAFTGPHTTEDGTAIVLDGEIVAYYGTPGEVISIPEGVRSIASNSVSFDTEAKQRVREVVFPEGLRTVGGANFEAMPMLEYITLPSTFSITWQSTFSSCPKLKKFKGNCPYIYDDGNLLMDAQGYVSDYAGAGITDYVLPKGVKYLEDFVFTDKPDLKSLTFPQSFVGIINRPFYAADNLAHFYGKYADEDGMSLVINGELVAAAPAIEYYSSPRGAVSICEYAIGRKTKTVKFDDGVTYIKESALNLAEGLETLILPASLKQMDSHNFVRTRKLKEIYFRSTVPPTYKAASDSKRFSDNLVVYVPQESFEEYQRSTWSFLVPYMRGYNPEDLPEYFSIDGNVTLMEEASLGNGIDIVLMGDAFTQQQIEDGTYGAIMSQIADAFFSVEPYKSFRYLFNVYRVDVVSQAEGYGSLGQALGTSFGEGTNVKGNDDACLQYASRAVSSERLDNTLVIVAMNSDQYAGTCYMYWTSSFAGDFGEGPAIAYFPLGGNAETLGRLVRHEAGGHGFAKLADEYFYEANGAIPEDEISSINEVVRYGWYKNIDFTSERSAVKWNLFLDDSRYASEGLGVFEGAATYPKGVYRPSDNSIMRDNKGSYNAPSRYAIWYRIHKLAYGASWQGSYEDFVAWDEKNRGRPSYAPGKQNDKPLPPLARPVVIEKSWR